MKVIKVNGKAQKVFVLRETEDTLIYIPLTSIQRVDYNRLVDIEKRGGDMLNEMRKTTLDNGRNALVTYDDIVQVVKYKDPKKVEGIRVPKPEDAMNVHRRFEEQQKELEKQQQITSEEKVLSEGVSTSTEDQPKRRRGPGRPPKAKPSEE